MTFKEAYCHRPPILSSKSECILSRRHRFCQDGGILFCQNATCSVMVADAPGKTKAINLKKTVSARLCEPGGCRLCFYKEK